MSVDLDFITTRPMPFKALDKKTDYISREAVHNNAETMRRVRQYGQRKAMQENGWSVENFIREFGKSYLDEDD